MKLNWGTGIFLFYSFFAFTLFYQVYKSTQYDHSLVVDNYYEEDLKYQSTLDKLNNSSALTTPLKINYYEGLHIVELEFPEGIKQITGSILFYRASNKKEDIRLPIRAGAENCLDIFVRTLAPGLWKIEVDWVGDGKHFLDRTDIFVPMELEEGVLSSVL